MGNNTQIGIYKITSPIGRIYIGQSVNIKRRFKRYASLDCKGQTRLFRSIKKHGWDRHVAEVIEICSKDDLDEKEAAYIIQYNCFDTEIGLNLKSGGVKSKASVSSRRKMSESQKKLYKNGYISPNKGRTHSEETKEKLRVINTGRKASEETKYKISQSNKGRKVSEYQRKITSACHKGKKISEETREKLRISHLGKKLSAASIQKLKDATKGRPMSALAIQRSVASRSKPINQFSKDEIFIKKWPSVSIAAKFFGVTPLAISATIGVFKLDGKLRSSVGFIWKRP